MRKIQGDNYIALRWIASIALLLSFFLLPHTEGVAYAQIIGAVASGVGTPTSFLAQTTLHQYLYFEIGTTPQSLKVTLNGKTVVCDLDTAGLNALRNVRSKGAPTTGFLIPLATGLTASRGDRQVNLDITIVNNVATAFNLYGANDEDNYMDDPKIIQSLSVGLNVSQSLDVENFLFFAAPSIASTDLLNVYGYRRDSSGKYYGGSIWNTKVEDVVTRGLLQMYQNQAVNLVTGAIDNFDSTYQRINFIPTAAQKVYVQRLADFEGQAITRVY